jgi:hypothetical protein
MRLLGFDEMNINISLVKSACKSLFRDPLQNSFATEIWVVTHRLKNTATDVCYKLRKSKVVIVWFVTPFILVCSY